EDPGDGKIVARRMRKISAAPQGLALRCYPDIENMSELEDAAKDAIDNSAPSRMHAWIGLLVALAATLMAIGNIKDGNVAQAMSQAQAKAVDTWAYYQAKSTKELLAGNMADQIRIQIDSNNLAPAVRVKLEQQAAHYAEEAKRYEKEKEEIRKQAEGFEANYDRLNIYDDQFDMAEAAFTIAIALGGISALTRQRVMFIAAAAMVAIGIVFETSGFLGWNLHPDWVAKLLG